MANINLRPWREELRKQKQKKFIGSFIGVGGAGVLAVLLASLGFSHAIARQESENNYLRKEVAVLDKEIKEVNLLKEKRSRLIERMQVIQELQGNRPVVVHMFDELVRTLPKGVYYQRVALENNKILLNGAAENNNQISELMRRLDRSDWFYEPNLAEVKATDEEKSRRKKTKASKLPAGLSSFELSVVPKTTLNEAQE